jgi:large subunit ribosomal protein L3
VKRKLPKEVPMPGAFRSGANDAAPAAPAVEAQEENA